MSEYSDMWSDPAPYEEQKRPAQRELAAGWAGAQAEPDKQATAVPPYDPAKDVEYQAQRQFHDKHHRQPDAQELAVAENQLQADLDLWRGIQTAARFPNESASQHEAE
jgi:hypothetical protein